MRGLAATRAMRSLDDTAAAGMRSAGDAGDAGCGGTGHEGIRRRLGQADARRPVEEPPGPQLERRERPELEIEGPPRLLPPDEGAHRLRLEQLPLPGAVREEEIGKERGATEPSPEGNGEALLAAVEDGIGQEAAQRTLENVFGGPGAELQVGGQRE